MTKRPWGLYNHGEAAVAATKLLAGARVREVRLREMWWMLALSHNKDGALRQFRVSSGASISADGGPFVDLEHEPVAVLTMLYGLIDCVVREVEALAPMHYRLVFDDKSLSVLEQSAMVDNAMVVSEHPNGVDIFCG